MKHSKPFWQLRLCYKDLSNSLRSLCPICTSGVRSVQFHQPKIFAFSYFSQDAVSACVGQTQSVTTTN